MKYVRLFENFNTLYTKVDRVEWFDWNDSHTKMLITNDDFKEITDIINKESPNEYIIEQSLDSQTDVGWDHKYTDSKITGDYLTIISKKTIKNISKEVYFYLFKYKDEYWGISGSISSLDNNHVNTDVVFYIIDAKEGLDQFISNVLGKKNF